MGSDTVCYIKSDLKNKFSYFKFEKDTVFQRNKADKNNIWFLFFMEKWK